MSRGRRRSRTSSKYIYYALQLYFTFQVYSFEKHHKGYLNLSQGIIWNWIQRYKPKKILLLFKPDTNYLNLIGHETLIKVGNGYYYVWLWEAAIEATDNKTILGIRISIQRNIMLVAKQFIQSMIREYDKTQYFNGWRIIV